MRYDTAGNKIIEPIQNCDCGLTGGCKKCNPLLWKQIEIEAKRKLDDFINEKVDFIKMDIEGSEAMAVKGMVALFQKNQSIKIMTEFYPALIRKSGENPLEFLKLLEECGFSINKINGQERRIELIEDLEGISKIEDHINLFCVKQ